MKSQSSYSYRTGIRPAGRIALVAATVFALTGMVHAAEPDLTPKTINLGSEFLQDIQTLTYILLAIAFLVANILVLMLVKDPAKLSLSYILGHFAGKDSVDTEMHHEYDGIRELDNPMPAWLQFLFYACIGFALIYMIHYHFMGTGPSSREEYEQEMAAAAEKYKDVELPEDQIIAVTDAGRLQAGASLFKENCATCHGEKMEGLTGPNLTDAYWIHGAGEAKDIYKVITEGVPGKTMISWKARISSADRLNLASYILSLQGSNPSNAKAPEGNLAGSGAAAATQDSSTAKLDSAAIDSGQ